MLSLPTAVGLAESNSLLVSRLLMATCRWPAGAGAPSRAPLMNTWRSLPTVVLLMLIAGSSTVAVIDWRLVGVWKPAGVVMLIVVVPAVAGLNAVAKFIVSPALNTAGLPTIVPTLVSELVTETFTVVNRPAAPATAGSSASPG